MNENRKIPSFFLDEPLETKVERGGRVFPVSDRAADVQNVLVDYVTENGAIIKSDSAIIDIEKRDNKITRLILREGEIAANNYILCTGGKSFPGTGSTGDGFRWSKKLGHHVTELTPALVPIDIKEEWVRDLQGLSLRNVEMNIIQHNKKTG